MLIVQDAIRGKLGGRQSLGWTLTPPPAHVDSQVTASFGPGRPGAVLVLRLADWGSDSIRPMVCVSSSVNGSDDVGHTVGTLFWTWMRVSGLQMVGNSFCEAPIRVSFLFELY